MKLMIITAAAVGALALAACTPAEDETAADATTMESETSTMAPATDGAMAPADDGMDATPVNPDGSTTPPGQTPPTLPTEPTDPNAPMTSPPPM